MPPAAADCDLQNAKHYHSYMPRDEPTTGQTNEPLTAKADSSTSVNPGAPTWPQPEKGVYDRVVGENHHSFIAQEYWQLRQELRDRVNSIRTILGMVVTAFVATLGVSAALLNASTPRFTAISA